MFKKLIFLIVAMYVIATSLFTAFTIYLADPRSPLGAYKNLFKVVFVSPYKNGWSKNTYEERVAEAFDNFATALANKEY